MFTTAGQPQALRYIDLATRLFPFVVALACFALSNRLYVLEDAAKVTQTATWAVSFWPWYALLTGVVTMLYGLFPRNVYLLASSGALVVSLFMSRAFGAVFQLIEGSTKLSPPQLHIAGIMYTLGALCCALIWTKTLRPSTHILKAHKTILGEGVS